MARKISFTRAERDAVAAGWGAIRALRDGVSFIVRPADVSALERLMAKMDAAGAPLPSGIWTLGTFLDAIQPIREQVIQVDNPAWRGRLLAALNNSGMSVEDLRELVASMRGWLRGCVSAITVAEKGPEWLARARAEKKRAPGVQPGLWDE